MVRGRFMAIVERLTKPVHYLIPHIHDIDLSWIINVIFIKLDLKAYRLITVELDHIPKTVIATSFRLFKSLHAKKQSVNSTAQPIWQAYIKMLPFLRRNIIIIAIFSEEMLLCILARVVIPSLIVLLENKGGWWRSKKTKML